MREFDRIIRSKVEHFESPVPMDAWDNIYKALPKKEKRPYPLYFLLVTSFVIIALGGTYAISRSSTKDKSKVDSNVMAVAGDKMNKRTYDETIGYSKLDNLTDNQNKVEESQAVESRESLINENFSEESINTVSTSSNPTYTTPTVTSARSINTKKSFHQTASVLNVESDKTDDGKQAISMNSRKGWTVQNNTSTDDNISTAQKYSNVQDQDLAIVSKRERVDQLARITLPSTGRVFGTDQSAIFEMIQLSMKKNASMPCPTFVKKQNISFFEVYFSNDYGVRSLESKSSELNAYKVKRENTEFPYFSYSVGARFGIGWESGIAFKSGLDYTQLNEKFVYVDPNSIQKKTITILKYVYDANFNVIDSIKTTEEIEIPGTNTIVNYNKLTFFDLPILFQYTIPGRKRLSYSVTAGPFINLSFSQSGKILSQDNKTLINIGDNTLFKSNIGLSMYAALGINYQLTKNTEIVFEPNIRYIPNTITEVQNPINQKYIIAGISASFRQRI